MAPILYSEGREIVSLGVPSLEHIAAVKITIMLWKQVNISTLMQNLCDGALFNVRTSHFCEEDKRQWIMREQEIREKVPKLPLPELLKTKILGFIKPIGIEMVKWKDFHVFRCNLDINFPHEFCWTPHGKIDKKKTAELMIKDSNISAINRYYLACLYCLEASVVEMWNTMPAELKGSICHGVERTYTDPLVSLWTHVMQEATPVLHHEFGRSFNIPTRHYLPYSHSLPLPTIFDDALYNGNKTATDYIWPKLTTEEKSLSLDRASTWGMFEIGIQDHMFIFKENYIEIFYFLLSHQNERQQRELLEFHASILLLWHLNWPWQDLFLPMANYLHDFGVNYELVLENIVHKILIGHEDYDYLNLLTQLWKQLPVIDQKQVIHQFASNWKLLQQLCLIGEEEKIMLILKNATLKELENIISFYPNCRNISFHGCCCDILTTEFYAEEVSGALYLFLHELYTKKAIDE